MSEQNDCSLLCEKSAWPDWAESTRLSAVQPAGTAQQRPWQSQEPESTQLEQSDKFLQLGTQHEMGIRIFILVKTVIGASFYFI